MFHPLLQLLLQLLHTSCNCIESTDVVALFTSHFGGGTGPIYLDNVGCSGSESNLMDCSHSSTVSCHSSHRGAGV